MHFLQSQMFVSRVYTQNIRKGWKNQAFRLSILRKLGDPLRTLFFTRSFPILLRATFIASNEP